MPKPKKEILDLEKVAQQEIAERRSRPRKVNSYDVKILATGVLVAYRSGEDSLAKAKHWASGQLSKLGANSQALLFRDGKHFSVKLYGMPWVRVPKEAMLMHTFVTKGV